MRFVRITAAIIVALAVFVGHVKAQQEEPILPCDKREVKYESVDPTFNGKIKLSDAKEIPGSTASNRKGSPQGTRYLLLQRADFSKPGPWTTTVFIGGVGLDGRWLKLSLRDHENGGVQVQWLNEKLLFIEVWWGRFISTDMILDINSRKFLYEEDAEYGDMGQPCR